MQQRRGGVGPVLSVPAPVFFRTSTQSFALAKGTSDVERIYLPHVFVDTGPVRSHSSGYGLGHHNAEVGSVAVIDQASGLPLQSSLDLWPHKIGNRTEECLLPRAAAVHEHTHSLLVSCFGTDVVIAYDAMSPAPAYTEKTRWRVGSGPSGIAVDNDTNEAVVWSQFDRVVTVLDLSTAEISTEPADTGIIKTIAVRSAPKRKRTVEFLVGRSLFHATNDKRVAEDGRACASCHPDGGDDGLVWSTPRGSRRTKFLAGGLVGTAPFGWDGSASRLEDHIRQTFVLLGGTGLRPVELRSLTSYVRGLRAPSKSGGDPGLVAQGAKVFTSKATGCTTCHAGDSFADNKEHNVTGHDGPYEFNTPTLLGLSGRAPYYHDGRFETLRDLLKTKDGNMGHIAHLSDSDTEALVAFLNTL